MKLHEYLSIDGNQARLAAALNKSAAQVWQWKQGLRPVPVELVSEIEAATDGQVMRWDLRPTDWHRIWPELVGQKGAPKVRVESN